MTPFPRGIAYIKLSHHKDFNTVLKVKSRDCSVSCVFACYLLLSLTGWTLTLSWRFLLSKGIFPPVSPRLLEEHLGAFTLYLHPKLLNDLR